MKTVKANSSPARNFQISGQEFPWYKWMNALMRGHPLVHCSGVANSAANINLGILDQHSEGIAAVSESPNSGLGVPRDLSLSISESELDSSDSASPAGDGSSLDDEDAIMGEPLKASDGKSGTMQKRLRLDTSDSAPGPAAKRRKGMLQHVEEIASADHKTRSLMMTMCLRARNKYKLKKHQMQHDVELARLKHEAQERDKQQEHELKLLAAAVCLRAITMAYVELCEV
ncbi:hypothetical protein BN946_scf184762.g9 [Trametes cinnabarina]|uniref:No apical meristem-associated C-terminal domain-containing protein n=1 Tax=Pycnoporus cinnabarinus TaxID=5643 RepID=A0A060S9B7_PYCCI|nr:hypothetical protein BN946_scf184762.g9 [Trametes cinnabarina]